MNAKAVWYIKFPCAMRSESHRQSVSAVVPISQSNDIVVSRVNTRHEQRQIVCFRARVYEVADFQISGHLRRKFFRVERDVWMQINRRGMLQRFILLVCGTDHVRVTMPDADRHDSAE